MVLCYSWEIATKDFVIPEGQHLNASVPIESVTDVKKLYQLDYVAELSEGMAKVFGATLDKEMIYFIKNHFDNLPYDKASVYYPCGVFDTTPRIGYHGDLVQWRETMLKEVIEQVASRIKNTSLLKNGSFSLLGNPLDTRLLHGVSWKFTNGSEVSDVVVDYSVGTFQGSETYKLISTQLLTAGNLYLVFTSSDDKVITYEYRPYYFGIEENFRNPNRTNIPNLMMSRRHTFIDGFYNGVGVIAIVNNGGSPIYDGFIGGASWGESAA